MKNIFKLVITERVITIIGAAFIFFQMFFSFTAFAATPKPDLTAVKSNNVGGNALVGTNTFTWQIHIANSGAATASWGNNKTVFQDNLPTTGVTAYGVPIASFSGSPATTGSITCSASGTKNENVTCKTATGGGSFGMPVDSFFDVFITVSPSASGTLTNPKTGGSNKCKVDPNTDVSESDEGNNACTDTVTVANPGSITIIKDTIPDDAQDFSFNTTGAGLSSFFLDDDADATLSNAKTFTGLNAGVYTVTEAAAAGFDLTGISCVDPTSNSSGDIGTRVATINVAAGETVICTFTNTKKGHLIVQKTTNPPSDPTVFAIFAMSTNGGAVTGGGAGTVTDAVDNDYEITPGTYSVAETVPSGWDKTGDACQNVSVAAGQTVSCLLTNTKQTKLTVVKTVINDNGGTKQVSDFILKIDGNQVTSGTANALSAGSHTVSETNLPGYEASVWGTDCNPDGTITLQQGDIKTCTVTNNDISAKLIVNKIVINDNGGTKMISDFPLFVSGVQVVSGAANNVNAGTYAVSENNQTGYASIIGGDCGSDGSVTLALGETRTCTVTNDDVSPSLTVTKTVTNDNGGTLHIADFSFFIDANQVFSGIANWINAGMHTVSETPVFGYQGTIGGQCNGNGLVSLAVGDVKTCTINNDDIQPTLTVEKIVINDNGGIKTVHDFPLFIDNGIGQVSSGVANPVNAGTYAVSETNQTGYAQSFGGDCDENGSVALSVGQNKVCQIINNDIPAKLIVNKVVVNDNGGVKVISDFPLFIGGIQVTSGATNTVNAGTYTVSENNQSGYAGTFSGDCDGNGSVALQLGETKTCLITNDDKPGEIHGMKFEDKNGNGAKDEEDTPLAGWSIYLDANDNGILDSGEASTTTGADGLYAFTNLSSGTYNVREVSQNGWMQTYPDGDSHFKHAVAVTYGGSEENLNFGNFKLATVTGYKWDDKNGDGVWRKSCEGQSEGCVAEPGKQDVVVALGRQNGEPKQENGHETVPIEIIAMTLTGGDGGFIFHNVAPGHYKLFEEKKNGWSATNPAARTDSFFDITYDFKAIAIGDPDFDLLRVTGDPDFDLLRSSFFDVFPEFSGQNVIQSEATKGLLTTIPGVPLEFGNHKLLVLSQEAATETKETSTVISWTTDSPGTSRVIYDTVSHPTLGSAPNYGYANSTAVFDESPKVTSHNVSISGLVAGTTYYYRTISAASPESVSSEGSFGTSASSSDGGSSGSSGSGGGGDSTGILIQNTGGGGGGGNYSEGLTNNAFSGGSSIALETIPPVAVALNAGTENTNDGGALLQQNQESFSGTIGNGQNANSKTGAGAKNNVLQQTAINKPETPQSKPQNTSLLAAIGSGITLGTGSIIVGLIVLLVLFGGGAFLIRKRWFI